MVIADFHVHAQCTGRLVRTPYLENSITHFGCLLYTRFYVNRVQLVSNVHVSQPSHSFVSNKFDYLLSVCDFAAVTYREISSNITLLVCGNACQLTISQNSVFCWFQFFLLLFCCFVRGLSAQTSNLFPRNLNYYYLCVLSRRIVVARLSRVQVKTFWYVVVV